MLQMNPHEVVELIDGIFSWAAQAGKGFDIHHSQSGYIRAIVEAVEQIPEELITLEGADRKALTTSRSILKDALARWPTEGGMYQIKTFTPGFGHVSPITLLRSVLAKCKDDVLATKEKNTEGLKQSMDKSSFKIDVFISHSSKDERIAAALITLIREALNIRADRIRCTSVQGYKLPAGATTDDQVRLEVRESKVFIGLLTKISLKSSYVLFELGARWGAKLHLMPLLAAGAGASILPGPLMGVNVLRCDVPEELQQLIHDIADILDIKPERPAVYQKCINELTQESIKAGQSPSAKRRA